MEADEKGIFDLPHVGRVIIGDRVSIGSQTTIDRGFVGDTILEHDVKIDNLVQVAHNVIIGSGSMLACLLYTSPSPRDLSTSRMPSSA